ncbi:MAG: LppX_LprAFG lipoprotein, partial [Catenulispora sp.]|nr:LppX_LprAFG lipoprotein [Catenulispora sp.]
MREDGTQHGRRHAAQAATAITAAAIGVAVIAGCASRGSGLAARSDKSADGAIQFAAARMQTAKSVHVHALLSGATDTETGTIDGSVVLAPTLEGDLTLKLAADPPIAPSHIIYDGKTVYTSFPQGYHVTSKSKPKAAWFAADTGNPNASDSAVLKELKEDPAALVKAALAKGKFTQAGSDDADGIAATRFTGDVTGKPAGHVDVWLDAAGLPVKLVFQSTGNGEKGRAEIHFSDWGKPVTITAPPAEEVLTSNDQADFAISGQQFKVSSDP